MKKKNDILMMAIDALKSMPVPQRPPQKTLEAALALQADTEGRVHIVRMGLIEKIKIAKPITKIAVAAVLIIAVIITIRIYSGLDSNQNLTFVKDANSTLRTGTETAIRMGTISPTAVDEEMKKLEKRFTSRDIAGLKAVLDSGMPAAKIAAANYLAQIGDMQVIDTLQKLSDQQSEPNNPFSKAVIEIKKRLKTIQDPNKTTQGGQTETKKELNLTVIDKTTGKPIAGIDLDINIQDKESQGVTNELGCYIIDFNETEPNSFSVKACKAGFVPMSLNYDERYSPFEVPKNYTLRLERGTTIGGYVKDEQERLIKDVTVSVTLPYNNEENTKAGLISLSGEQTKSDANGFWKFDIIPAQADKLWLKFSHPDYICDDYYGDTLSISTPIGDLRAQKVTAVMKKGIIVSGRVLDLKGKPIAKAIVIKGDSLYTDFPQTKTDPNGCFSFGQCSEESTYLTVTAKGYAPDMKLINIVPKMEPVIFNLGTGNLITGRVVNQNNIPLKGAWIDVNFWRGLRTLQLSTKTNAEGRFEFTDAPKDAVQFNLSKEGYMAFNNFPMSAEAGEYIITLYPPITVTGSVVDADTNELIPNFKLTYGVQWEGQTDISWQMSAKKSFTCGKYKTMFTEPGEAYGVRIEADGYLPANSPDFNNAKVNISFNFRLKKGRVPKGIVYLPDGQPAQNAEVIFHNPSPMLTIQNGESTQKALHTYTQTSADGSFTLPSSSDYAVLVVLHDKGYAEVLRKEFESDPNIKLAEWGRIEGYTYMGTKPGAGETVTVSPSIHENENMFKIFYGCQTIADANGFFRLDKVPAGKAKIVQLIKTGSLDYSSTTAKNLEILPGQTAYVELGGKGRTVIGKVVVPSIFTEPLDWSSGNNSIAAPPPNMPKVPYPENFQSMTETERTQWLNQWYSTEEGKVVLDARKKTLDEHKKKYKRYTVKIGSDGSFLAEDVRARPLQADFTTQRKGYYTAI